VLTLRRGESILFQRVHGVLCTKWAANSSLTLQSALRSTKHMPLCHWQLALWHSQGRKGPPLPAPKTTVLSHDVHHRRPCALQPRQPGRYVHVCILTRTRAYGQYRGDQACAISAAATRFMPLGPQPSGPTAQTHNIQHGVAWRGVACRAPCPSPHPRHQQHSTRPPRQHTSCA
jgi:hypothetical protein